MELLTCRPRTGEFTNGRGEFFDQEDFGDKSIFVRFVFDQVLPARSIQSRHSLRTAPEHGNPTGSPPSPGINNKIAAMKRDSCGDRRPGCPLSEARGAVFEGTGGAKKTSY